MRGTLLAWALGAATSALVATVPAEAQFVTNYPLIIVPPPQPQNLILPKRNPSPPARPGADPQQQSDPPPTTEGADRYQGRSLVR